MKISKITKLKNNKYNVLIDNQKYVISGDVLIGLNILKPQEITKEEYNNLIKANDLNIIYNKVLRYCFNKKRTESEIKNKIISLHGSSDDQKIVLAKLKEQNYLNNDLYIQSYINDQIKLTLNGPKKIIFNLKKLGFKDEIINDYLSKIDEETWFSKIDILIKKRQNIYKNISYQKFILKLKNDFNNLGYPDKYYVNKLNYIVYDDEDNMLKDYLKYYQKFSKKYNDYKLDNIIKNKLYSLGYDLNKYEIIKSKLN